jgi:hypothetical protein
LRVERGAGAEDCPDAEQLGARVAALLKGQPTPSAGAYRVQFARSDNERRATLSVLGGAGQAERSRVLHARGPSCEALAQATAVTLALLFDEEAHASPPAQELTAPAPIAAPHAEPAPTTPSALTLALGGGALLGVTRTAAPLLLAEIGYEGARFRIDLGALGVPVQRLGFSPGSLREWLAAGSVRACYLPYRVGFLSLGACLGAYVGVLDVRARGYTRNERRQELWASLPVELFFGYMRGPLGFQIAAAALVPLHRPDFSIDGLGSAYASWPVSAALTVRVLAAWQNPFGSTQKK